MKYKIENSGNNSPRADQFQLMEAIKALPAVARATLRVNSNELEISAKKGQVLSHAVVAAAASNAGFLLYSLDDADYF